MKLGNVVAIGIGALATLWAIAGFIGLDLFSAFALPFALIGILLVAITDRRYGWTWHSTLALVLCLLPWAAVFGFSLFRG